MIKTSFLTAIFVSAVTVTAIPVRPVDSVNLHPVDSIDLDKSHHIDQLIGAKADLNKRDGVFKGKVKLPLITEDLPTARGIPPSAVNIDDLPYNRK